MTSITYSGKRYACRDNESMLDAFLRHGVNVPFSCKNGVCHACLLRSTGGKPPSDAQRGIKPSLAEKDYFMSCKCHPEQDMQVALPRASDILTRAVLAEKELLSDDICRLMIEPSTQLYYHAGQFINLHGPDGVIRSYSLASVPTQDYFLELHIKRVVDGEMTNWIFDAFSVGDEIEFHGPLGDCYYKPGHEQQSLLFISTGTGLAPHIGIVRDALGNGHKGAIYLYHGSVDEQGHYLRSQLAELASKYANFKYFLSTDAVPGRDESVVTGNVCQIAFDSQNEISDWLVFLSGNPEMVASAQEKALKLGVSLQQIRSDPFEHTPDENEDIAEEETVVQVNKGAVPDERRKFPDPDPEMWAALDDGKLMTEILTTFYDQVFEDELLSPYFVGVTKQRLIEKVYNFHYQMFTGEKVYFGERPRNSHHWMVIPEGTFDYRENLMRNSLRKHGLAEHLVERWLEYEYLYKEDIVKAKPINKILFGEEVPYEGFDTLVMECSGLCDSCQGEINVGDTVRYHVRMGTTYCAKCTARQEE